MYRILCVMIVSLCSCDAFRALVINSTPGKSHSILMDGVVRHLVNAGHQITYITTIPTSIQHVNVTNVDISTNNDFIKGDILNLRSIMDNKIDMTNLRFLLNLLLEITKATLQNPNVKKILADENQYFDVMIAEWMYNEVVSGISAIYKCPYIWLSSLEPHWMVLQLIDELPNPAYHADPISKNIIPLNFFQRATELFNQAYGLFLKNFYYYKEEDRLYKELIVPYIKDAAPSLDELRYNASLILGNSHASLGTATRLPQNYIPVGGYHIDTEVKELPDELKKIMDNAKDGVIYFSLGSNLKSKDFPKEIKSAMLKVFNNLKQSVVWKFEEDLADRPKNVHIVKWAPQQSILAHPNCILFITHGGLLSTTEALHFGVPIIGIPVFADQFINVDKAVERGFAIRVDLSNNMANELKKAIEEVLGNHKYRERMKELTMIYHSRLVPPGRALVQWTELAVRTRGAAHLRSPALRTAAHHKLYLDLLAAAALLLAAALYLVKKILKFLHKIDISKKIN